MSEHRSIPWRNPGFIAVFCRSPGQSDCGLAVVQASEHFGVCNRGSCGLGRHCRAGNLDHCPEVASIVKGLRTCDKRCYRMSSSAKLATVKNRGIAAALLILLGTCLTFAAGQKQPPNANYTVYQVGGDVKPPRPLSKPMPPPPAGVDRPLKVRVSFVVAPDGSVGNIRLLKRSRPDFDQFAVSTVSKWRFEPAEKDGKPVAVRLEAEVRSHR